MKDYRVTVKVRNNRILAAIAAAGGEPGNKWCTANGLSYSQVNDLINMTSSPLKENGAMRHTAEKLCEVLNKLPEDLWSNDQLYPLEKNFSEMEMDHAQVVALLPADEQTYLPDFSELERAETGVLLDRVLATLTEREQNVVKLRVIEELTIAECAKSLGVTPFRIVQIERKALHKLREPYRVGMLIDATDIDGAERVRCKAAATRFLEKNPEFR